MECAICLENYDAKVKRPMMIDCGHTFCRVCLEKIKLASNQCPFDSIIIKKDFGEISINFALEEVIESILKLKVNSEKSAENANNEEIKQESIIRNLLPPPRPENLNSLQINCANQHILEFKTNINSPINCTLCQKLSTDDKWACERCNFYMCIACYQDENKPSTKTHPVKKCNKFHALRYYINSTEFYRRKDNKRGGICCDLCGAK